jgi:hypothetical protein
MARSSCDHDSRSENLAPGKRRSQGTRHDPSEPSNRHPHPGSGHIGGTEAQPEEYERRIVAFFDQSLLGDK